MLITSSTRSTARSVGRSIDRSRGERCERRAEARRGCARLGEGRGGQRRLKLLLLHRALQLLLLSALALEDKPEPDGGSSRPGEDNPARYSLSSGRAGRRAAGRKRRARSLRLRCAPFLIRSMSRFVRSMARIGDQLGSTERRDLKAEDGKRAHANLPDTCLRLDGAFLAPPGSSADGNTMVPSADSPASQSATPCRGYRPQPLVWFLVLDISDPSLAGQSYSTLTPLLPLRTTPFRKSSLRYPSVPARENETQEILGHTISRSAPCSLSVFGFCHGILHFSVGQFGKGCACSFHLPKCFPGDKGRWPGIFSIGIFAHGHIQGVHDCFDSVAGAQYSPRSLSLSFSHN